MSDDWKSENLSLAYNGLCGVINATGWAPTRVSMEERKEAAEKSFKDAFESLERADAEIAGLRSELEREKGLFLGFREGTDKIVARLHSALERSKDAIKTIIQDEDLWEEHKKFGRQEMRHIDEALFGGEGLCDGSGFLPWRQTGKAAQECPGCPRCPDNKKGEDDGNREGD